MSEASGPEPPEPEAAESAAGEVDKASRAAYVAVFVAVIGLVGTLSTLLITEFLDERDRRRFEEEQAYIQLGNSVVLFEQSVASTQQAIIDLYLQYEEIRESADDGELLNEWRDARRNTLQALIDLDRGFASVREAREQVYFNADTEGIQGAERLYQAARNRRVYLRHAFDLIPADPRTSLTQDAADQLLYFENQAELELTFGDTPPLGATLSDAQCPDLSASQTLSDADRRIALESSYVCLIQTHVDYIEFVSTRVAE